MNARRGRLDALLRWMIFRVYHPLLRSLPRVTRKRHILMVCNGAQMVEHLASLWEVFKHDENLVFALYLVYGNKMPGETARISHKLPIEQVGKWERYLRNWDLVITPDHIFQGMSWTHINTFSWPTLHIPHGITNKRVKGEVYAFGRGCYDKKGRIRYTKMLLSGEAEKRLAIEMNPEFFDRCVVVGSLICDRLVEMSCNRDAIRQRLGIAQNEILVLVLGTFGPTGLYNMMGESLLPELRRNTGRFRFALSIHPLEYITKPGEDISWGERLSAMRSEGFLVLDPGDDWEPYMVACDIILTDHTSLALYGVALGRHYVYAPVPDGAVEENGPGWQLQAISPILNRDASNLLECLDHALTAYPTGMLKEVFEKISSYPGKSRSKVSEQVYALLYP